MDRTELNQLIGQLPQNVAQTPLGGTMTPSRRQITPAIHGAMDAMRVAMEAYAKNDPHSGITDRTPDYLLRENKANANRLSKAVEQAATANRFATRLTRIEDNG